MRDELRNHFRPEFLNRVDDIIVFRPLSREDLAQIVDLQLTRLERMLAARHLRLEVTPEARELLADAGLRPGVRRPPAQAGHPARAAESDRARSCWKGAFQDGDTIRVERDGDHLRLVSGGSRGAGDGECVGARRRPAT